MTLGAAPSSSTAVQTSSMMASDQTPGAPNAPRRPLATAAPNTRTRMNAMITSFPAAAAYSAQNLHSVNPDGTAQPAPGSTFPSQAARSMASMPSAPAAQTSMPSNLSSSETPQHVAPYPTMQPPTPTNTGGMPPTPVAGPPGALSPAAGPPVMHPFPGQPFPSPGAAPLELRLPDIYYRSYATWEEAYNAVDRDQTSKGYILSIRRSTKHPKLPQVRQTTYIGCQHSGVYKSWERKANKYKSSSRKTSCPWTVTVDFSTRTGSYSMRVLHYTHNHQAIREPLSESRFRLRTRRHFGEERLRNLIESYTRAGNLKAKQIATQLSLDFPELCIIAADVQAIQRQLRLRNASNGEVDQPDRQDTQSETHEDSPVAAPPETPAATPQASTGRRQTAWEILANAESTPPCRHCQGRGSGASETQIAAIHRRLDQLAEQVSIIAKNLSYHYNVKQPAPLSLPPR